MSLLDEVGEVVSKLVKVGSDDVPEGTMRFYRAQGPKTAQAEMGSDLVGRYFTPHLDSAFRYAQEAPDREILSLDVSYADMYKHNIQKDQYETVMPAELIDQAKPYYTRQRAAQDMANSIKYNGLGRGR